MNNRTKNGSDLPIIDYSVSGGQEEPTMSSRDFLNEIINPAREQAGESSLRNNKFIDKVCRELDLDRAVAQKVQPTNGGTPQLCFELNQNQMMLVGMRESKAVRRLVLNKMNKLSNASSNLIPDFNDPVAAARAWADNQERLLLADKEVDRLQGVCNTMSAHFAEGMTACKFAKQLNGVNVQKVNGYLVERGVLQKEKSGHSPTAYYRDRYFRESVSSYKNEKTNIYEHHYKPELTIKGAKWLFKAYLRNDLPMKVDWDGEHTHAIIPEDSKLISSAS